MLWVYIGISFVIYAISVRLIGMRVARMARRTFNDFQVSGGETSLGLYLLFPFTAFLSKTGNLKYVTPTLAEEFEGETYHTWAAWLWLPRILWKLFWLVGFTGLVIISGGFYFLIWTPLALIARWISGPPTSPPDEE